MIEITVNGEKREVPAEVNLAGLLEHFGLPAQRVAVELNKEVIRRGDWESIAVKDNDKIEIVHFVGGG